MDILVWRGNYLFIIWGDSVELRETSVYESGKNRPWSEGRSHIFKSRIFISYLLKTALGALLHIAVEYRSATYLNMMHSFEVLHMTLGCIAGNSKNLPIGLLLVELYLPFWRKAPEIIDNKRQCNYSHFKKALIGIQLKDFNQGNDTSKTCQGDQNTQKANKTFLRPAQPRCCSHQREPNKDL